MNLENFNSVVIHDVGMRDGLQMESESVDIETKIEWIEELIKSGIDIVQVGSFVHTGKIPQMADTDELFQYFNKPENKPKKTILSALVLNEKGMERGLNCNVGMFCMGVSASETHSMKNTGMSTSEAQSRIIKMAKELMSANKRVQVSVQSAFGCGFEGDIAEDKVLGIVKEYHSAGIKNISLADTAGYGNPAKVQRLYSAIRELDKDVEMACHFHNTYGMGLANCLVAIEEGVKYIETAFGGLGGCPFTKLAAGNVCTEDFVHTIQNIGFRKDIDLDRLIKIAKHASGFFVKDLPGFVYKSGGIKH
ncbi:MAG: hydroxymethylglutaryl-CoA lyase [Ignavibacteriae bacterium]|nr:hydroxymethylglutaryl-CoA lyase [Ignavibacteriota bacterium]